MTARLKLKETPHFMVRTMLAVSLTALAAFIWQSGWMGDGWFFGGLLTGWIFGIIVAVCAWSGKAGDKPGAFGKQYSWARIAFTPFSITLDGINMALVLWALWNMLILPFTLLA